MEATTSSRMHTVIVLYDMHTDFFPKVLAGISDADAHNRLDTKANHIAWIAGSLLSERYDMARSLGIHLAQSTGEFFKNHEGIRDGVTYPTLAAYQKDWDVISPVLKNAYKSISDEKLDSDFEMPGMKMTVFDMISFTSYREANCIGQIALWRRLLGYDAMKYD